MLLPPPVSDQAPNLAATVVQKQIQAMAGGNLTALKVPWYVPTRSAKTFHPKTCEQNGYKQLIMEAW